MNTNRQPIFERATNKAILNRLAEMAKEWRVDALCDGVDPDIFFPDRGGSAKEARKYCDECPVAEQCLDYAIETNEPYGIWAGKTKAQRNTEKRKRAAKRRAEQRREKSEKPS